MAYTSRLEDRSEVILYYKIITLQYRGVRETTLSIAFTRVVPLNNKPREGDL